jgi:drug/metabolite transporter (DMT)-like permease
MSNAASTSAPAGQTHALAAATAAFAALLWSLGIITVRLADDADSWQYLVWRSLGCILALELIGAMVGRPFVLARFLRADWRTWAAAAFMALSAISFIYAIKQTSAANALFLASTSPLINLILGWLILGERLTWSGVGAIALGLIGLLLMVGSSLEGGDLIGNIAAVMSAVGFAGYVIFARRATADTSLERISGNAFIIVLVCLSVVIANGRPIVPPVFDITMAAIHGIVFIALGVMLFNRSTPHLSAVGLVVMAQVETVLGPVWAFLFFAERPGLETLLGGALILAGVVWMAIAEARRPVTPPAH